MGRHVCFQYLLIIYVLVLRSDAAPAESHADSHESESISMLLKPSSSISPPSAEIGFNSSENQNNRHDSEYSSVSDEEDPLVVESSTRIERRQKIPRESAGEGEMSNDYFVEQFRKMPDVEDNYHEADADYDNDPTTEQYGEAMRPSIPQPAIYYPPAQDRFITRHSTKVRLPHYTPIFHTSKIIPHGPKRGRGRKHRPHYQPHPVVHESHGWEPQHHQASSPFQKYVPSYISYGPIMGQPPPQVGSHSQSTPVYVPSVSPPHGHHVAGHGPVVQHHSAGPPGHHVAGHAPVLQHHSGGPPGHHVAGHRPVVQHHSAGPPSHHPQPQGPTYRSGRRRQPGYGQQASYSQHNHWTIAPSVASAPPLPPFLGNNLGPPMAAIYIPPSPSPVPSTARPVVNRYPAALPYQGDEDEDYYYEDRPPKNSYLPPKNFWKQSSPTRSHSRKRKPYSTLYNPSSKPYASQSDPVYTSMPSGNRDRSHAGDKSYQKPGKSIYGSPPMSFGQPMHNFGPPMSSYGQPPPIMGEVPTSIYEPTDEMYRYKNDPPSSTGGTNFPRNKYGGITRYHQFHSEERPAYDGYKGDSSELSHYLDPNDISANSKPYEQTSPSHKIRINPNKRFRSPQPGPTTGETTGFSDNSNDYSSLRYQSEGSGSGPGPGSFPDRPHPSYDTRYNSPGLSKDPKLVDWMPYSAKEYRELKDRQRKHRSKKERYSTLPDSIQSHTPDPDHENYPKLTYDAIKKRVMALADLQTSSTNLKKHLEEQKELQRVSSKSED